MSKSVALITGGASGIGLALTRHLLSKGWRVIIADRNAAAGEAVVAELGPDALFHQTNVTDYADQVALFKRSFAWGGDRLDLFVANAAVADQQNMYGPPVLDDNGDPRPLNLSTLDVDLSAVFQGMWLFKHYARKNSKPGGKVILAGSMASFYSATVNPQYCAAKHAIVGLVRGAGRVLPQTDNITVNAICPGFIPTPLCPPFVLERFPKDRMSPMEAALRVYDVFLDDDSLSGQTVELSNSDMFFTKQPEYCSDTMRWLGEEAPKVWEAAYRANEQAG